MLGGIGLASTPLWAASNATTAAYKYNLHYAPHLGMFRHHAGEDPIDQLNFMADQGFTAFEDNDMRNREVGLQEKMAVTMKQRGLRMGVFVAHQIYWQKPNLASGDAALRTEFLEYIKNNIGGFTIRVSVAVLPLNRVGINKHLKTLQQSIIA